MPTFINTNTNSLNVQMALNASQNQQTSAMQRLATGLRINSAADNAAGFAIVTRMASQIAGDTQAAANANDGISLAQTAGGDLTQITNNLQTMRNLAVQASNATNSASDRAALNNQLQSLSSEIQRVSQTSSFNGVNLLDGTFTAQNFQVGANAGTIDQIQIASIASASTTQLGSAGVTTQATTTGTATTAALIAGDLTLNGIQVGASAAGAAPGQAADSASSIANAINTVSGTSGVTATANATATTAGTATTSAGVAAPSANVGFTINGVAVDAIAAGGTVMGEGANTAAAINMISSQTGVTATANATTGAVTLSAADGRDIAVAVNGTYSTLTADTGLTAGTTRGTVTINSSNAAGIMVGGGGAAKAGLTASTTAIAATTVSNVNSVSNINISTAAGATAALSVIDGALAQVTASQAALGAVQNRFTSVVTSLQTTATNLTASQSRIQSTDYAAETANLSRAQILQQAGNAMLAQANQQPNQVMTLLR
jgi:flagellin